MPQWQLFGIAEQFVQDVPEIGFGDMATIRRFRKVRSDGASRRDRTCDLRLIGPLLYRLSYGRQKRKSPRVAGFVVNPVFPEQVL